MAIRTVILNGQTGDASVAAPWIRALNTARIVQEKGGFLFKAAFAGDQLMLAVTPSLVGEERRYHYNQHLKKEDAFTLIGMVNACGVFTILFQPESRDPLYAQGAEHVEVIRRFAAFLFAGGYRGEGPLDEVTQSVLSQLGLSPAPTTLAAL